MPEYSTLTSKELEVELKKNGLPIYGTKPVKLERLLEHHKEGMSKASSSKKQTPSSSKNRHLTPKRQSIVPTPRILATPKSEKSATTAKSSAPANTSPRASSVHGTPSSSKRSATKRSTTPAPTPKWNVKNKGRYAVEEEADASLEESEEVNEDDQPVKPPKTFLPVYVALPLILLFCFLLMILWFDVCLNLGILNAAKEQLIESTERLTERLTTVTIPRTGPPSK
eukprot:GEMP01033599.1.p1 GENE.GEMP01033599.1~~GEMP01033599.1.p1  ORF type:complete len:226 (+),score=53.00 GEMP01033599.1:35-712(+)